MQLYKAVEYAAVHGFSLCIEYDSDENLARVIVSKKVGDSVYQDAAYMHGTNIFDPHQGELLFWKVKNLVTELKRRGF